MNLRPLLGDAPSKAAITLSNNELFSDLAGLNKLATEVCGNAHQMQKTIQAALQPSLTALASAQEAFRLHRALGQDGLSRFHEEPSLAGRLRSELADALGVARQLATIIPPPTAAGRRDASA